MKLAIKTVAVLALTVALAKVAYMWSALDPFFNSNAWQRVYVTLATWLGISGPEEGDNLVMVVILVVSFGLALALVAVGSRYILRPLCQALQSNRR